MSDDDVNLDEWDPVEYDDDDQATAEELEQAFLAELEAAHDRGVDRDQVLAILDDVHEGAPCYEIDLIVGAVRLRRLGQARQSPS